MSTYQDFLAVVTQLKTGTVFNVTYDWCTAKGLTLTTNIAKSWGQQFANDYPHYKVRLLNVGSDNLHCYEKL